MDLIRVAHDGYRNWPGAVPSEPMVRSRQSLGNLVTENKRMPAHARVAGVSDERRIYPLSTKDTDVPGLKEAADTDDAMLTVDVTVLSGSC